MHWIQSGKPLLLASGTSYYAHAGRLTMVHPVRNDSELAFNMSYWLITQIVTSTSCFLRHFSGS